MRENDVFSTRAAIVAQMRTLRRASERAEQGRFLLEGENALEEALCAGLSIDKILVDERRINRYDNLLRQCAAWSSAPEHVIAAASEEKTPQGIVAIAALPVFAPEPTGERLLALDAVQDPGNVGAMIRLCAAAGWDGLLLGDGCADPYAPKVVRASAGLVARVPVWRGDLCKAIAPMKQQGHTVAVSAMDGEDFYTRQRHERLILVIGNEGRGVSERVSELATYRWSLPMPGGAESLNAAMAAAAMVYDEVRQRRMN